MTTDAPIGAALSNCATQCTAPAFCGGTLATATTSIEYCTLKCKMDTDCPTGTACFANPVNFHCLKKCTGNSDCSGGFVCSGDAGANGSYCWSPFNGADNFFDSGAGADAPVAPGNDAAGAADTAPAGDSSSDSMAPADAGVDAPVGDAGGDGDASATSDGPTSD